MNRKLIEKLLKNKEAFVPLIFTEKQMDVLSKYISGKKLANAEKKALYTSITKKIKALEMFSWDCASFAYFLNNARKIIDSRFLEAKNIIDKYSMKYKQVFVAGSFLFSREYADVDVFVVCERGYKETFEDKHHIIFLTEKKLKDPVFQSAAQISVANFIIPSAIVKRKPKLSELMSIYHEAIIEKMQNDKKQEQLRRLVFIYGQFCENTLFDGLELADRCKKISLEKIDMQMNSLCEKLFSKTYLYIAVHDYVKTLDTSIKNIRPNVHLVHLKNNYEDLIYGRERSKAEIN